MKRSAASEQILSALTISIDEQRAAQVSLTNGQAVVT
jgi:hypothetical protein